MFQTLKKQSQSKLLIQSTAIIVLGSFSFCFTSYSQAWPNETESPQVICFQTFNAYGPAYARNLAARTETMGEELYSDPCSVVQMQETWTDKHFSLVKDALSKSIPTLQAVHFDKVQAPYIGKSGLSTYSRSEIAETNFEKFTVNQDGLLDRLRGMFGVIKGMGEGLLSISDSGDSYRTQKLRSINVHLHPNSIPIRIAQTTQILQKFERLLPLAEPMVISGDFNFEPDSIEYGLLRDVGLFVDSYKEDRGPYAPEVCTYCEENPQHWGGGDRVIDFIWLRSSGITTLAPSETVINLRGNGDLIPSDHYGVRTYIALTQQNQAVIEDDRLQERREQAIKSIDAALIQLQKDRSTIGEYLPAYQALQRFRQEIGQMDPNSRILQQMLIP